MTNSNTFIQIDKALKMGVQLRYFIRITLCTLVSVVMLCSCASNPDRHLYTAEEIDAFFSQKGLLPPYLLTLRLHLPKV